MKVGVTGGTGFLGSHVAARLRARGDRIVIFTRDASRLRAALPEATEFVEWNPLAGPVPASSVEGLDGLVHLLGESVAGLWTRDKKERIASSRIIGTRNLVEGIRQASSPPRVLLSGSAVGFYGDRREEMLTEDSPPGTGFFADLCRQWEDAVEPVRARGVRVVSLRTSLPLDPSGGFLRALLPPFHAGLGAQLGNGRQWVPWIHLQDWLDLVLVLLDRDAVSGPVNLSSPEPVRHATFVSALGRALHRPVVLRVPTFVLRLAPGGMGPEMLLSSQRVIPAVAQRLGHPFRFPDLTDAFRDLFPPVGAGAPTT